MYNGIYETLLDEIKSHANPRELVKTLDCETVLDTKPTANTSGLLTTEQTTRDAILCLYIDVFNGLVAILEKYTIQ